MAAKVTYPGYCPEPNRGGTTRHRVRVKGNPKIRITLPFGPEHEDFKAAYNRARRGETLEEPQLRSETVVKQTVAWLSYRYEEFLASEVKTGHKSEATLKQRTRYLERLRNRKAAFDLAEGQEFAGLDMAIPRKELIAFRDDLSATPGAADKLMDAVRAMYTWAIERELVTVNPALGIKPINKGEGATPWSVADLKKYRQRWKFGTKQHLALSVLLFTACRVGDVVWLGRDQEVTRDGLQWLEWQPRKKGSEFVSIPLLPPLYKATRAQTVVGDAYVLTHHGKPYGSTDSFRNNFKRWCVAAGLPNRSPHGVRKAAGNLLAELGATQYEIMAIHGHSSAENSEVYTKGASRRVLAASAMERLKGMDW
ncbi:MAG: tyrosine-type recombinase/integrase [Pseudomonadota bacterium]